MKTSGIFKKSQLFLAICAAALCAETFVVSDTPLNFITISVIFFAALFIYNAARLSLSVNKKPALSKYAFEIEGNSLSILLCIVSIVTLFGLLTACHWLQVLIFIGTALLSMIYMMPFKKNGVHLLGLRNNLFLKNIILSFTWASATVLFPLSFYEYYLVDHELIYMFLRRFFFIYSLTVIYDFRDLETDTKAGMETIALRFGQHVTKLWSLTSLALFVLFIYADPGLSLENSGATAGALFISGLIAAIIVIYTQHFQKKPYYSFVVDSAMVIQFVLVFLLHE